MDVDEAGPMVLVASFPIECDKDTVWVRVMQGSCDPLSRLRIPVLSTLQNAIEQLETPISAATVESGMDEADTSRWAATRSEAVAQLKGFVDDNKSLDDLIKDVGERVAYGVKAKGTVTEEDVAPIALWRWVAFKTSFFSKRMEVVRKGVKSYRVAFGKTMKAANAVHEHVLKNGMDVGKADAMAKLTKLEEGLAKAKSDLLKEQEKKREAEEKKRKREGDKDRKRRAQEEEKERKKRRLTSAEREGAGCGEEERRACSNQRSC